LEQAIVHLERVQRILASLRRVVADKLQQARRTSADNLRKLLASSLTAIVFANAKIAEFRLPLFIALKKVAAHTETTFKSQASIALEQATAHLDRIQRILASLSRDTADKLQEARRTSSGNFRKLLANSLAIIVFAKGKIAEFRLSLFNALKKVTVHFQRAQETLTRLGRSVIDKPRMLQEARRISESNLQKLLANSPDAIVVTDGDHRFVCANPKALDLFGVTELNMRKFSIDAFLSHRQILELRRKWFAIRRDERYGKCKIRRLDGSLRVADYIFVDNFISRQDLYRFQNVAPPRITQLRFSARMPISHTDDTRKIDFCSLLSKLAENSSRTYPE
jgi:PAS domain S-box-containing protein